MIVWLHGTHGAGKTTTAALLQKLLPNSRVLDAKTASPERVAQQIADSVLRAYT
ncbi:hypothetical protein SAMN06295879_0876 [Agreia bicolorata]|uniref:AAA domain-containing protein n=1 Tax=Agreia bicolorata TaxID=110935 RepID=A0A1T4XAK4_9MICO|nr:hypothetical protein [Agreia bicolorata]SKA86128.1 hypothetical protein SAMN06295879_0876 [Agreia bicolorata]